jgi:hypothetical protein
MNIASDFGFFRWRETKYLPEELAVHLVVRNTTQDVKKEAWRRLATLSAGN